MSMQSFSTADLLDQHPESTVMMEDFISFGMNTSFFGQAKTPRLIIQLKFPKSGEKCKNLHFHSNNFSRTNSLSLHNTYPVINN